MTFKLELSIFFKTYDKNQDNKFSEEEFKSAIKQLEGSNKFTPK